MSSSIPGPGGGYSLSPSIHYSSATSQGLPGAVSLHMTTDPPPPWEVDVEEVEIIEHFFSKELRDMKTEGLQVSGGRKYTLRFPEGMKVTYEVKDIFKKMKDSFWNIKIFNKGFIIVTDQEKMKDLRDKCKSKFPNLFIKEKNGCLHLFSKSASEVSEAKRFLEEVQKQESSSQSIGQTSYYQSNGSLSSGQHMIYSITPWYITKEKIEVIEHFYSQVLQDLQQDGFFLDKGNGCLKLQSGKQKVSSDVKKKFENLQNHVRNLRKGRFIPVDKSRISHLWKECSNKFPDVLVIISGDKFDIIAETFEKVWEVKKFLEQEERRTKSTLASAGTHYVIDASDQKRIGDLEQQGISNDVTRIKDRVTGQESDQPLQSFFKEDNLKTDYNSTKQTAKTKEINFEFLATNGIKVKVYEGDLLKAHADCIVNAANIKLRNDGGVAMAISRACGPGFDSECRKLIGRIGSLSVTKVQQTSAGLLSSNFRAVLHAVGPCWDYYRNKEKCLDDLQTTWQNVLHLADVLKFQSVAMPVISSGIFAVPENCCAEMCLYGILEFFENYQTSSLREVHIVDKNPSVLKEIKSTYGKINQSGDHKFLNPLRNLMKNQPQHRSISGHSTAYSWNGGRDDYAGTKGEQCSGISLYRQPDCKIKGITAPIKVFKTETGLTIKVYTGSLVKFKGDAIVCSADEWLSGTGPLARAIETAGGSKYKESFNKMRSGLLLYSTTKKLPPGTIHSCAGGDLAVSEVFHVVIETLVSARDRYLNEYSDTMQNIFRDLLEKKVKKVALPLIGAGLLTDRDLKSCCHTMVLAMMNALKACKSTSLEEIHLINKNTAVSPLLVDALKGYVTTAVQPSHHGTKSDKDGTNSSSHKSNDKAFTAGQDKDNGAYRGTDRHNDHPPHRQTDRGTDHHPNKGTGRHTDHHRDRSPKHHESHRGMEKHGDYQRERPKYDERPHTAGKRHNFSQKSQGSKNSESQYLKKHLLSYKDKGARPKYNNTAVFSKDESDMYVQSLLESVSTSVSQSKSVDVEINADDKSVGKQRGNLAIIGVDSDDESDGREGEDLDFQGSKGMDKCDGCVGGSRKLKGMPSCSHAYCMDCIDQMDTLRCFLCDSSRNVSSNRMTEDTSQMSVRGQYEMVEEKKDENKQCVICMDTITDGTRLECGHEFCRDCIKSAFSHKPVCPMCGKVYAALKGNQPKDGIMRHSTEHSSLPGYEGCGTIIIEYKFPDGIQEADHPNPGKRYNGTDRRAYLPDNEEGKKVFRLLRKAFDQRLTFTIGSSRTTGQEDVVTWNDIHHKTKRDTGAQRFGYPDPTYLQRVQEELAAKGITE